MGRVLFVLIEVSVITAGHTREAGIAGIHKPVMSKKVQAETLLKPGPLFMGRMGDETVPRRGGRVTPKGMGLLIVLNIFVNDFGMKQLHNREDIMPRDRYMY